MLYSGIHDLLIPSDGLVLVEVIPETMAHDVCDWLAWLKLVLKQ